MREIESLAGADSELAIGRRSNCVIRCYGASFQAAIDSLLGESIAENVFDRIDGRIMDIHIDTGVPIVVIPMRTGEQTLSMDAVRQPLAEALQYHEPSPPSSPFS